MKTILKIIIGLFIAYIIANLICHALDKSERAECMKWQAQAEQYQGFYLTQWQAQQCMAQGVEIDAPIK